MSKPENPRILALFDVDGTLTVPRGEITEDMMSFMNDLSTKITVGIVGGEEFVCDLRLLACSFLWGCAGEKSFFPWVGALFFVCLISTLVIPRIV